MGISFVNVWSDPRFSSLIPYRQEQANLVHYTSWKDLFSRGGGFGTVVSKMNFLRHASAPSTLDIQGYREVFTSWVHGQDEPIPIFTEIAGRTNTEVNLTEEQLEVILELLRNQTIELEVARAEKHKEDNLKTRCEEFINQQLAEINA